MQRNAMTVTVRQEWGEAQRDTGNSRAINISRQLKIPGSWGEPALGVAQNAKTPRKIKQMT